MRVPFDQIYTSVFLITEGKDMILVDCATTAHDVDDCIVPALEELGIHPHDLTMMILTHRHSDHAGGLARMRELVPQLRVVTEERAVGNGIVIYPLPGHTEDSLGVLDLRTNTLISGDGLQGAGVDRYRCSLKNPVAYVNTLEKLRGDERIKNVLFSHAYEPWNEDTAFGREKVLSCIEECKKYIGEKK